MFINSGMEENNEQVIVDFEPLSRRMFFNKNKNVYENLIKAGIQVRSLCGGKGSCGKCRIMVEKGLEYMNPPTSSELRFLSRDDLRTNWRLACQTLMSEKISDKMLEKMRATPLRIYLPEDLLHEDFKILTKGTGKGVEINPTIKKIFLNVQKPVFDKPIPDFESIVDEMWMDNVDKGSRAPLLVNLDVLRKIPHVLRESDYKITITTLDGKEIIDCEPGNTIDQNFGIAFDIGTTTIVSYLINLLNGKIHAISSKLNPQTAYGEDVITRLSHAKEKDGLQELRSAVLDALNDIMHEACSIARIQETCIYEASIVGNTAMHHIFLGLDPKYLGLSPYVPVIQQGLNIKSRILNLNIAGSGNVYVAPIIAGYVGADTVGVMVASKIDEENELTLALDIGTNGELVVGNRDVLAAGSCAAGSALEGAHISCGMRAASGAIDSITIDPDTFEVRHTTIKNKPPRGLCGSGLIDLVAEMLRAKILTRSGNFNSSLEEKGLLLTRDKEKTFIIVHKNEAGINHDITISQEDIRQVQLAKGAFYSGTRIILNHLNKVNGDKHHQIEQIYLAGAFGNYINKENAKFIGMIPDLPSEMIHQIGNAAGTGSQYLLLNKELRKKASTLVSRTQYVEIGAKKEFQREFAGAMFFPHLNLDFFPSLGEYLKIPKR